MTMIVVLWLLLVGSAAAIYPTTDLTVSVCSTDCHVSWGATRYHIADYEWNVEGAFNRLYYQTENTLQTLTLDVRSNGTVSVVNGNCFCQTQNCSIVICANPTRFFHFQFAGLPCINSSSPDNVGQQLFECVCYTRGCEASVCCPPTTTSTTISATVTPSDTPIFISDIDIDSFASSDSESSSPSVVIGATLGLGALFILVVLLVRRSIESDSDVDPDLQATFEEPLYADCGPPASEQANVSPPVPPARSSLDNAMYDMAGNEHEYLAPATTITEVTTTAPLYDTRPPSPSNIYDMGSGSTLDEDGTYLSDQTPPVYNTVTRKCDDTFAIENPMYDNTLERPSSKQTYLWVGAEEDTYDPRTVAEQKD